MNPGLLRPLRNAIALMLNRASVKLADGSQARQTLQLTVMKGELRDGVEHWQPFGFTALPQGGAQAIAARLGGHSDHMVALVVEMPAHRPTDLQGGESAMYNAYGHRLVLLKDGTALLRCQKLRVEGDIESTGEIKDRCDSDGLTMQAMREVYNAHRHTETGLITETPDGQMEGGA